MPFAATALPAYAVPSAYVSDVGAAADRQFHGAFTSDAIRSLMSELEVANAKYPLRHPCMTCFIPVVGEYLVQGFSPVFVGRGETLEEAREDWRLSVHSAFQNLLHKRPFEMTAADRDTWTALSSRIDVAVYRNTTPVRHRQHGRVRYGDKPFPSMIEWEDGRRESLSITQVDCPDFVTYKPGQPVEAIVLRDPVDFHLLKIAHIERRPEPARLEPGLESELLESIGSNSSLSVAGWE